MTVDYAPRAQIGLLTPQANTTVEPELWALMPAGASLLNARLTSAKATVEARLVDYTQQYAQACDQFANAPLTAIVAACTGASYLIGKDAEAALAADITAKRGVRFVTAALATVAALRQLDAKRIALLSPYPDTLNDASKAYWESHGFTVSAITGPRPQSAAFHPIYTMTGSAVHAAHTHLSDSDADVVVMLGTGMPTLRPLLRGADVGLLPAISCNLALAWCALQDGELTGWMSGAHWRARFNQMFPDAS